MVGGRGRERPILLVTPYSLESNPYVRLLLAALRTGGHRVELARGRSPILLWRSVARHGRPSVVHLQWQHPYLLADRLPAAVLRTILFFTQLVALRALGVRFVWTVHNIVEHERRHVRWELLACRVLARLVHTLVVHCHAAAEEVAAAYRVPVGRVRVVPHGLMEPVGDPDRAEARRSLGLDDRDVFLLNFGRIRPYKGIDRLLGAFRQTTSPRLRLAVVGFPDDPTLPPALERAAGGDPRVTLRFEAVEDEELSRLLAACDAVVLPYRDSLTSGAAVLAGAHGRPVIAPRLGCLREFPADAGLLYDPDGGGALEAALREAEEAPLAAMGEASRRYVRQYPWSVVAEGTWAAYEGAVEARSRAGAGL